MRLDIVIPTFRRPGLLRGALASIARAERPLQLGVAVVVVNNDATPDLPGLGPVLDSMPYPARVMHEPAPGKSAALNGAISQSTADYLGFVDDDEELAPDWFRVVEKALARGDLDFVGGRQLPFPDARVPEWLPANYSAVLGFADAGDRARPYGPGFPGVLMGGNAVIARATLERVGPYNPELGPRPGRRLLSCEDEDMYLRLLDAGARGAYLPDLVVYHHLHPDRLRGGYYRAWTFWNGAAKGLLARHRPPEGRRVAGVPRYVYGDAIRGVLTWARHLLRATAPGRLAGELPLWHLAGQLYGVHMCRTTPPGGPAATLRKERDRTVATL